MMEKATARMAAKNNTTNTTGKTVNPFTILNSSPDNCLKSVMVDMNIDCENLDEQIGVFRAEEIVRAALAEANYNQYLEKLMEKDKNMADDSDLTMGGITNTERDVPQGSPKGGGRP